jgi:hypothetical protein
VFDINPSTGDLSTLDGADVSSSTVTAFIFPEIRDQGFSQFHVANPNAADVTASFELHKSDGQLRVPAAGRTIRVNGAVGEYFTDLFPNVIPDASDYIRVTTTNGVVPFSYFGPTGYDAAGLNGIDISKGSKTLYAPQYAVGGPDWGTTLSIVNVDNMTASVILRLIGDNGAQIGMTQQLQIPALGKALVSDQRFFLDSGTQLTQGYVQITSNARLVGSVVFGDPTHSRQTSALPLISSLDSSLVFGQVASGPIGSVEYWTGMALLNPSGMDAHVTITVFDRDGRLVASKVEPIPAYRRSKGLLTEYFPGLMGQTINGGYITVTSDQPLASYSLFGVWSLAAVSAVPPQIIQ